MALAKTGRMRPSMLLSIGFERSKSFFQGDAAKSTRAISSSATSGPFTLGNNDRQLWVAQQGLADSGDQVEHVGSSRWAEVLLPLLEIAGRIVFVIRLIPSEAVFADAI
jgi:hypothetical protein